MVAGEGAPGGFTEGLARRCPAVNGNRAIAQVCDGAGYCRSYRRVLERCRVNEEGGVKRAPEMLVGEGNGTVQVLGHSFPIDIRLREEAGEGFGGEAYIVFPARVTARALDPGILPTPPPTNLLPPSPLSA